MGKLSMRAIIVLALVAIACSSSLAQGQIQIGYATLTPNANNSAPAGSALFSYINSSGILVSQAGVGATPAIRSGRMIVDETGAKTGIALANPSDQDASITLTLRDSAGALFDHFPTTLGAHQHTALFVSELFVSSPAIVTGSLTFESNQPLGAITLRETRNAFGEPLYTTIPVLDMSTSADTTPAVFPQIAIGSGFTTQVLLMNATAQPMRGRVEFRLDTGTINFPFEIAPQGIYRTELNLAAGPTAVGYAVVTPDAGSNTPAGTAVFRFSSGGSIVTEAGAAATRATTAARIYVDYMGTQTGVALANSTDTPATISLTLLDRYGFSQTSAPLTLGPRQHIAKFVHEMFSVEDGYTGLLEIRSNIAIVPIALKLTQNSRSELVLTTLPVADLDRPASNTLLVFPHIVIGSGFTTQLILINGSTTTESAGQVAFYESKGNPMTVPMTGQTGSQFGYRIVAGGGRQLYPGNPSTLTSISLIDPDSKRVTSELAINEGNTVRARFQMIDSIGARRDDFDPVAVSLDTSVAQVDAAGSIVGKKSGFSTLSVAAGGVVANFTATVVRVDAGVAGYETSGIVQDPARRLYLASAVDHVVLLSPDLKQTPQIYAGVRGTAGLKNDVRLQSQFNKPSFLALNQAEGSLYLSDTANNVIRRIRAGSTGRSETLAGTGAAGSANGPAQTASFNNPQGIALDSRGYLWVADSGNHTIRRINLVSGIVETIAGGSGTPGAADGKGAVARFNSPSGIAVETETAIQQLQRQARGTPPPPVSVIVADSGNGLLRRVKESGDVETIRTSTSSTLLMSLPDSEPKALTSVSFSAPSGVAIDAEGNIFVAEPTSGRVAIVLQNGDVVSAAQAGTFANPTGLVIAEDGKVVVAGKGRTASQLVYGQPQIASIAPTQVSKAGGQSVTIKGSNFSQDALVVIGGTIITGRIVVDSQTITFTAPSLLSGRSTLTIQTRGGASQAQIVVGSVPLSQIPSGYITTVAGGSTYAGEGALATASPMSPGSVTVDVQGNVFITDGLNAKVRRVDRRTGILTTVAGNGQATYSGDGGPAIAAGISAYDTGVAFDSAGNLFIADNGIRRVDARTGIITTVVQSHYGYGEDVENALDASFNYISGFAVDADGNLYLSDRFNNRVRRFDAKTNIVTTIAGTGQPGFSGDNADAKSARLNEPVGIVADNVRKAIYIADTVNHVVRKIDLTTNIITTIAGGGVPVSGVGDGGPATAASLSPWGLALDANGNLVIADRSTHLIRRIDMTTGIINTIAGGGPSAPGDGGPATGADIGEPFGVTVDAAGNVFIAELYARVVQKVDAITQTITTLAGNRLDETADDGGPATAALLHLPSAVTVDAAGNLFFVSNFRVRRVDAASGTIKTIAGGGQGTVEGGPATQASLQPGGGRVAVDQAGNVYVADRYGYRVRKIDARTNALTTVAGNGIPDSSGDGGPAINASIFPQEVALDRFGNLYIVENDNPSNTHRIRKVDFATGIITTIAGRGSGRVPTLSEYVRIALDAAGNLFIADGKSQCIYRIDAATQAILTVAGGGDSYADYQPATSVALSPAALDLDKAGNLYILDYVYPFSIRVVQAGTGIIRTVVTFAPESTPDLGDAGPASNASVSYPLDVTVDSVGNLFIADTDNARIRAIRAP